MIAFTRTRRAFAGTIVASLIMMLQSAHADQGSESPHAATNPAADPLASMRVDHVMVHAIDFEASYAWYRDKLGFRPVVTWTVDGLDDTDLSYLQRNGFMIELVSAAASEKTSQQPKPSDFAEHFAQRGFTHLCFVVEDVDATLAAMNERGVPTFSGPIDFPALGVRVGFVQDPDGNVIEFKGPMAGNNVLDGEATWQNPRYAPGAAEGNMDESELRALIDRWVEGWSPRDSRWTGETLRPLYAQGNQAITVFDNVAGDVVELASFDAYAAQWEPMMAPMRGWSIALERPADVTVEGDLALVSFVFAGGEDPAYSDASRLRQFGTHVYRRTNDGWKIIHEHLTADTVRDPTR